LRTSDTIYFIVNMFVHKKIDRVILSNEPQLPTVETSCVSVLYPPSAQSHKTVRSFGAKFRIIIILTLKFAMEKLIRP